jgi:hypothetical protein
VPEPGAETTQATLPGSPAATVEQQAQAAEWAASIEDDELRNLVARAAAASLAKRSG